MSCCNSNCNHDPCGSSFNQKLTMSAQYAQYAQTQANKAEDLWLEFNALYLGAFAVAPTQDNQGNPLQVGALYWNIGASELYAWNGLAWVTSTGFNEFTPFLSTGSTTPRNLATRMADVVNVKDFGAVGDGVADDTAAFSAAVFAAPAANNINGSRGTGIPRALICNIYVPAGTYKLSSMVNTYGKEVVWELNQAAILSNPDNLNGEVWRIAQRQSDNHHGSTDFACGMAFRNNVRQDSEAEVLGITNPSELAIYTDRDTVGIYVDNSGPPALLDSNSGVYTSKTVITSTVPSQDTLKKFRKGMIIDTKHSPKWSGIVESWNANGTEFTVTDWFLVGGGGVPSTPTNGIGFFVNAFTKVWTHNANVGLFGDSHANQAAGFELGLINNKSEPLSPGANPKVWGYDCVNLGVHKCESAFIARGNFWNGFQSYTNGGTAFSHEGSSSFLISKNASGEEIFKQDSNVIELGNKFSPNTPYIDFFSSGSNTVDFDARIYTYGGNPSITGKGGIDLVGEEIGVAATVLHPTSNNATSCGSAIKKWTQVFAVSGTINTSDSREKTFLNIEDAEKSAAIEIKSNLKKFKFNSAIDKKGENARIHFGVSAQEVGDILKSHGLDPDKYGFYCYDEWDELEEIKDKHGNIIQKYRPSGNCYGIRYEELLAFIISAI